MTTKEIEDLLARYFNGETSIEEEKLLRDAFITGTVPPHLAAYQEWFAALSESHKDELSDPAFEESFLKAIDESKVIPMHTGRRLIYFASLAAGVLLLFGLFFTAYKNVFTNNPKNTITNPDLAYAETQKALFLLCGNFKTGLNQVEKFGTFDKGMDQIQNLREFDRGIQQVQKFSDFNKFQELIINPDAITRP